MGTWPSSLGKERPVSDEMHLISPALHKELNLVLLSVPQLQSLEKPHNWPLVLVPVHHRPSQAVGYRYFFSSALMCMMSGNLCFKLNISARFENSCSIASHFFFFFKCSIKHIIFEEVNFSAGLYVCREVCIWLGAPKSSLTSVCPFSFILSFLCEHKKAKCGLKSLVIPRQVKPLLPGTS